MRELNRGKREVNFKVKYAKNNQQENVQPRFPSWDMEELDLTARYAKVENYSSVNELKYAVRNENINQYKPDRNE